MKDLRDIIPKNMRMALKEILVKIPVIQNHPLIIDSVDRSDRYLKALKEITKNTLNKNSSFKQLHQTFKTHGVRSDRLPKEWWANFIILASTLDVESTNLSEEMIKWTKNFEPQILKPYEWREIYFLCLRVGLFHIGYTLRDLSRKCALIAKYPPKNINEKKFAATAAMELQQFDKASNFLNTLEKTGKNSDYFATSSFLLNKLAGLPPKEKIVKTQNEQKFYNYLYQKTIAVVGPAKTNAKDAQEIDSFELVVRINYTREGKGCDPIHNGLRCDITYFNLMQAEHFIKKSEIELPDGLKWLVLKHYKHVYKKINKTKLKTNIRYLKEHNKEFNMIPNSVFDLICFNPKRIKIYHADLMLTPNRFLGYYPKELNWDNKKNLILQFCKLAPFHDPVTQYAALSNLWEAALIEGDKRFNEVMGLGCEEYMRQLQKLYGDEVRVKK